MSLDVYLIGEPTKRQHTGIYIREGGVNRELTPEEAKERYPDAYDGYLYEEEDNELYHRNITHNLNTMAEKAGIYNELWRPDEIGITRAEDLIEPLREGLHRLKSDPEYYQQFNPENGWGSYETLIRFVSGYLDACYMYKDAKVEVSR